MIPPCPPLIHNLFRYQKFFGTQHKRVPLPKFSAFWYKKLSTANLDSPLLLLSIILFATGSFLKHNTKGFLCQSFRHCETKHFRRKILTTLLISIVFRCRNFSETHHRSVPLRLLSALQDKKISTENFDTPPAVMHNLFRHRKFSETQYKKVPLPNFSGLWFNKLSTENLDSLFSYP